MKKGDVVINPYVPRLFNGKLNPLYATIYVGNNQTIDYKGRKTGWSDRIANPRPGEREWRVIGHVDLFQIIGNIVMVDEEQANRYGCCILSKCVCENDPDIKSCGDCPHYDKNFFRTEGEARER